MSTGNTAPEWRDDAETGPEDSWWNPDDPTEGPRPGRHRWGRLARPLQSSRPPLRTWLLFAGVPLVVLLVPVIVVAGRAVSSDPSGPVWTVASPDDAGQPGTDQPESPPRSPSPTTTVGSGPGRATTAPRTAATSAAPGSSPVPPVPPGTTTTPPPITPLTTTIHGIHGRCLDVENGNTTNGTLVQLWTCIGQSMQVWTRDPSGALLVLGGCLQVAGGGTTAGSLVRFWSCTGSADQRWHFDGAGHLVNDAAGLCLTDPSNGADYGIQLDVIVCGSGAAQQWTMA